jgi:small conductance mechanosensitive channel
MDAFVEQLPLWLADYGPKVIGALVILILGRIAASIGRSVVQRMLERARVDAAVVSFMASMTFTLVVVAAVLAALSEFGVQTASFIAILGAAGFAVGFALQGSLANFAAGVLILVLRPFRVGHYIDVAGVAGTVMEIHLFTTTLNTVDNIQIMVPNGQIYGNIIKNYSANETRRIDLVIGIAYGASIDKAMSVINEVLDAEERVLAEPERQVAVAEMADSSVNLVVRPWVQGTDYWPTRFELTRQIKEAFDAAGIEIPFPQHVIHMAQADGDPSAAR